MVRAYVLMEAKPGFERTIVKELKTLNQIEVINELYGEWDIIIRVAVDQMNDLDTLLSERIRKIEGVTLTSTMIIAEYKY